MVSGGMKSKKVDVSPLRRLLSSIEDPKNISSLPKDGESLLGESYDSNSSNKVSSVMLEKESRNLKGLSPSEDFKEMNATTKGLSLERTLFQR